MHQLLNPVAEERIAYEQMCEHDWSVACRLPAQVNLPDECRLAATEWQYRTIDVVYVLNEKSTRWPPSSDPYS